MKFSYGQNAEADKIVERLIDQNIKACQSAIIDMLFQSGETDGFTWEDVENVYINPSNWTIESVYEFADDHGIELDDDPRKITDREELEELACVSSLEDYSDDELREEIAEEEIESWKDQIRDWSSDNPQEVYQWFLVDSWLCEKLRDMGEVVLDNDYGYWWGRGCCGQSISLDSTFYKLAESLGYFSEIQ